MTVTTPHSGLVALAVLCALLFVAIASTEAHAAANAQDSVEFQLKGVLITSTSRRALVNGTDLLEGERLGNIEITAIRMGEVDIRRWSRRLTVPVGATADWELASPVARSSTAHSYGPVRQGETLSEIAESLLVDGVTMNQMMIALYDANRDAFAGNINVLREGATLRVPDQNVAYRRAPVAATAEVIRHAHAWRGARDRQTQPSPVSEPDFYGPVSRGETLSAIAANLSRDQTTVNQMMIALFEANPQALHDNINILRAGAVLRIPGESALRRYSYDTATAVVMRHMDALRHDTAQPHLPPDVADELMTHHDKRISIPGAVPYLLLSIE